MWPFKKKLVDEAEAVKDEANKLGRYALRPFTPLRLLKHPVFDTEYAGPSRTWIPLFIRPMGQINTVGRTKTQADTNLTQAGMLGSPREFDWFMLRTEFDPAIPLQEILAFRFFSRLSFRFGEKFWFNIPLSYVPFTAYRSIEELQQLAPVLVCENTVIKCDAAWDKAIVVKAGERPPASEELMKDRFSIYKTEISRRIDVDSKPLRIRSQEAFMAQIDTDWGASDKMPKVDFAVRLYLEGLLYVSV